MPGHAHEHPAAPASAARRPAPAPRDARSPARLLRIPLRGWGDIARRIKDAVIDDDVTTVAAGTTYYLLLSLVPMLSMLVSVYGLFSDPATVQAQLDHVRAFVPSGGMDILEEQLQRLVSQPRRGLGIALGVSLALALWTANAGMKAIIRSINVAYDTKEDRGFIRLTLTSMAFTIGMLLMMMAMIATTVVLPGVLAMVGVSNPGLIRYASLAVLCIVAVLGLSALYRWGPCRRSAYWKWFSPGAALTLVFGAIAGGLFSWYVTAFGSYNKTYGSLGAMIGFITWIWVMSIVLIVGAEIDAELERQVAHPPQAPPAKDMAA